MDSLRNRKLALLLPILLFGCGGSSMPLTQKVSAPTEATSHAEPGSQPTSSPDDLFPGLNSALPGAPGGTEDAPTFKGSISHTFKKYCSSCHNAAGELTNYQDYSEAFAKRDEIMERVVLKKDMPIEMVMPDSERNRIRAWIRAGAPEGDDGATPGGDSDQRQRNHPRPDYPRPGRPSSPGSSDDEYIPPQPSQPSRPPHPIRPDPADPVARPTPIGAPSPNTAPVFQGQVDKILNEHCVNCHEARQTHRDWADYRYVKENLTPLLDRVIIRQDMPMNGKMTSSERETVLKWVRSGAPFDRSTGARPPVTYRKEIRPLLEKHCARCHEGLDYRAAYKIRGLLLDRVVVRKDMPPEAAAPAVPETPKLTEEERSLIEKWIQGGALEGEAVGTAP